MKVEPIEEKISRNLKEIISELGYPETPIYVDIPPRPEAGDFSTNLALLLSKSLKISPLDVAGIIVQHFPTSNDGVEQLEIAGPGFINFRLGKRWFYETIAQMSEEEWEIGRSEEGMGRRFLFEYVSANPTGPLNVVSARAGSVGDALVRIFRHRGFDAESEYYINDSGRQVEIFGASVRARLAELEGKSQYSQLPPDGYLGDYVYDIARAWRSSYSNAPYPDDSEFGRWAVNWVVENQKRQLERFRVVFNSWFWESQLYEEGRIEEVVERFGDKRLTYHKDNALYFQATSFGDTEDRVLRTSDGRYTYRVPDIAYHLDKWHRGYEVAVTILGPDHHGHIITIRAALKALDLPENFYQPLIVQQVNLRRGGEEVKMSKRTGMIITLDELIDEVGVDAARFFFLLRRISSPLDFDLELAKSHSEENPVYYVQYAHARIASILRQPQLNEVLGEESRDIHLLIEPEERLLMRQLAYFSWTLASVVRTYEPHPVVLYLLEMARLFHLYYQRHRVITSDKALTKARVTLCKAVKNVLKVGLGLIGVEAPDRM